MFLSLWLFRLLRTPTRTSPINLSRGFKIHAELAEGSALLVARDRLVYRRAFLGIIKDGQNYESFSSSSGFHFQKIPSVGYVSGTVSEINVADFKNFGFMKRHFKQVASHVLLSAQPNGCWASLIEHKVATLKKSSEGKLGPRYTASLEMQRRVLTS